MCSGEENRAAKYSFSSLAIFKRMGAEDPPIGRGLFELSAAAAAAAA
jgi:hypothetical protein